MVKQRTKPPKRRKKSYWFAVAFLFVCLTWNVLWFVAPRFYLWQMEQYRNAFSVHALGQLGPRVLPHIFHAVYRSENKNVGSFRSQLILSTQRIRTHSLKHSFKIKTTEEMRAIFAPVSKDFSRTWTFAYLNEPNKKQRAHILMWLSQLDFRMRTQFFCGAFSLAKMSERTQFVSLLKIDAELLSTTFRNAKKRDRLYPWSKLRIDQVKAAQNRIKIRLSRCSLPLLLNAVTQHFSTSIRSTNKFAPVWVTRAIEILGQLSPFFPQIQQHLGSWLLSNHYHFVSERILDGLAANGAFVGEGKGAEWLYQAYTRTSSSKNKAEILGWVQSHFFAGGSALMCRLFPHSSARSRGMILFGLNRNELHRACLDSILPLFEFEMLQRTTSPIPSDWLYASIKVLRTLALEYPIIKVRLLKLKKKVSLSGLHAIIDSILD